MDVGIAFRNADVYNFQVKKSEKKAFIREL